MGTDTVAVEPSFFLFGLCTFLGKELPSTGVEVSRWESECQRSTKRRGDEETRGRFVFRESVTVDRFEEFGNLVSRKSKRANLSKIE